ncbi:DnaJ-domain-containing protein [Meira miltonrushii]|uniref:DnaJ-domain-containing protein n=1 Tax=Meira miltonrushii TaxID=1280837 RepID=A0A316V8E3_9BASI|nr:DnaJ-domain-containing protein [Meira miltonrushii]PWN33859.1 DnaJ-domain-containing protein [Meira miltonrushii]
MMAMRRGVSYQIHNKTQWLITPSRYYRGYATQSPSSSPIDNPFPLPSSNATPYDIFHLPRDCTSAQIKSRYYDLVKIYHPDKAMASAMTENGQSSTSSTSSSSTSTLTPQKAHDNFKRIREAYTLLGSETKRRMYDNSGYGWNASGGGSSTNNAMDGFQGPVWNGGFPRNAAEWAAYDAWSASLKRGAPGSMNRQGWQFRGQAGSGFGGHDRFGWQHYAGNKNNPGANWFYGYGHAQHFSATNKPRYTSNLRFIASLSSLTAVLAIFQYARLQQERQLIGGMEDRRHQSAVQSLSEARKFARSEIGRARMEEMRKKARELPDSGENGLLLIEDGNRSHDWEGIVGRGGPSGKSAYEERMRKLESSEIR